MGKSTALTVEIACRISPNFVDRRQIRSAVRAILADAGIQSACISIAVVDDPSIHRLNRQYLNHDYPTDVLSFVLEERSTHLEGEIVVSAETANRNACEYRWPAASELLLYVIHGTLHLVGHDDHAASRRAEMRKKERHYLEQFGIKLPTESPRRAGRGGKRTAEKSRTASPRRRPVKPK